MSKKYRTVFVVYTKQGAQTTHENRKDAERFASQLRAKGINAWVEVESH